MGRSATAKKKRNIYIYIYIYTNEGVNYFWHQSHLSQKVWTAVFRKFKAKIFLLLVSYKASEIILSKNLHSIIFRKIGRKFTAVESAYDLPLKQDNSSAIFLVYPVLHTYCYVEYFCCIVYHISTSTKKKMFRVKDFEF